MRFWIFLTYELWRHHSFWIEFILTMFNFSSTLKLWTDDHLTVPLFPPLCLLPTKKIWWDSSSDIWQRPPHSKTEPQAILIEHSFHDNFIVQNCLPQPQSVCPSVGEFNQSLTFLPSHQSPFPQPPVLQQSPESVLSLDASFSNKPLPPLDLPPHQVSLC